MSQATEPYNPDYDPTGIEGGVDTNLLPWIALDEVPGMYLKPMRASAETGAYSVIVKLNAGANIPTTVYLSGLDLTVLSGQIIYKEGTEESHLKPGTWGYISANSKVAEMVAVEDSEFLANFYGAAAFLDEQGSIASILTSLDIMRLAKQHAITLVPSTLSGCMQGRAEAFTNEPEPLAINGQDAQQLVDPALQGSDHSGDYNHPHFVDTRQVPWLVNPDLPDIGLKILRVSEDNGMVSLIVRQNGVASAHTHLGSSDFLILNGRIGYRAGPPEGYGPGVWFFEPSGARHDATQRVTDEDLIYTANVYGPLIFDEGKGTPVSAVLSWIEYKALAAAFDVPLIPSNNPNDSTLLASAILKSH
jgi:quercetin dioxygenase-like cupin family protein